MPLEPACSSDYSCPIVFCQVRELLKSARYEDALAIITACLDTGEAWAGTALAQTGLLQLQVRLYTAQKH